MSADTELVELANRRGIEAGYHDIWGTWHRLRRETALALLGAMGVRVEAAAGATLETGARDYPPAMLPPVLVVRRGDAMTVPIHVRTDASSSALRWVLHEEDGAERRGETRVEAMRLEGHVEVDGDADERRLLALPDDVANGYHDLEVEIAERRARMRLIVAPRRCHPVPATSAGDRYWGITLQLYGLRSARNWGMGDFGDLCRVIDTLAPLGVDMLGLNPLHALFPDTPSHASPYSPSSRRFLNPAYLEVEAMADFAECGAAREQVYSEGFQQRLARLREPELVDYEGALGAKYEILKRLYRHFRDHHLADGSERSRAFERFRAEQGDALRRHAVFEAIHAARSAIPEARWPPEFLDCGSGAVEVFAREHEHEVRFAEYLQWQSALQLAAASEHARSSGMRIGLYLDLAVGSDSHGADAWCEPELYARGVSIGAPPDDFSLQGQIWGLCPWTPQQLRARAYEPFVEMLRANIRPAGALRIDHVLGLMRLFLVPSGRDASDGAYVRYPLHDLLAIVALESEREECVVVGEDLGTIPDTLRTALAEYGLLSYRVLYFEKHWHADQLFRASWDYPRDALVTAATHDLATFAGFWTEHDLELRERLELFPDAGVAAAQREARRRDRRRLLDALDYEGLRPQHADDPQTQAPSAELVIALHRFLARTPSALLSVQMEDVLRQREQANLPGTVHEHPNWRRKLTVPIEDWGAHRLLIALAAAIGEERGRRSETTRAS